MNENIHKTFFFTFRLDMLGLLGEGTYGEVHRALDKKTGRKVRECRLNFAAHVLIQIVFLSRSR